MLRGERKRSGQLAVGSWQLAVGSWELGVGSFREKDIMDPSLHSG